MNIVQLHERTRYLIDAVASTRFEALDIDNALNIALDNKVRESYDRNRLHNKSDSFQSVQRVRDELGPIVKKITKADGLSISGDLISLQSSIDNFRYTLALRIKDSSGSWYPLEPLTLDRKNVIDKNPYRRVRSTPFSKFYYNELEGKYEITHNLSSIDDAELYYLAEPTKFRYGQTDTGSKTFSAGDILYATETTEYNSVIYIIGSKIVITSGVLSITSGEVLWDYDEAEIRSSTHEEIARKAAVQCLHTAGEHEKAKSLQEAILSN